MKHYFIINKFSGKKDSCKLVEEQLGRLSIPGAQVAYTSCRGDATRLAREFVSSTDEFVRVYACGGDGTINEVISGVYDLPNCAVAPVPIGSGNDFIRSLGCPSEDFLNIEKLISGSEIEVDLLRCNDKISVNSVTIGFDCAVAKNVSKFKRLKFISSGFAYKLSIFYCLFSGRKHSFKIIADGEELPCGGTYLLSVCAKGKYYGGGIKCSPLADNSDGKIDFMSIPTIGVFKFISLLSIFVKGEHIGNPKLSFIDHSKYNEITYKSDTPVEIGIDGEIFTVNSAEISVLPKAQKIIIPR